MEAKDRTSQQHSILWRATHDETIVSELIGMLVEGEEKSKKEAVEEARLKALQAQKERLDEEGKGLQEARKGKQAHPQKEKQEKKVKKSRDGGSQKDR